MTIAGCYLNNAATAYPRPPAVDDAMLAALHSPLAPHRRGTVSAAAAGAAHAGASEPVDAECVEPVSVCRRVLAQYLGVSDPRRVSLLPSATVALNQVIWGVALRRGLRAVTTVAEHNSVLRPLRHAQKELGGTIDYIGLIPGGGLDVEALCVALRNDPTIVAVTHASNVTGRVFPVASLFAEARAAGAVTLLDASQTVGCVDVFPDVLNADFVAFAGHKGLLGPEGTGGMVTATDVDIGQVLVGGTGSRSDLLLHPPQAPDRFEAGTPNVPGIAGLAAAVLWRAGRDPALRAETDRHASDLRQRLEATSGVSVVGYDPASIHTGIVSFVVAGWDVADVGQVLAESFGVAARTGLHCAPLVHQALGTYPGGTVRLSPGPFTTDDDIERATSAVGKIAQCGL